jgi:hypothetical protein
VRASHILPKDFMHSELALLLSKAEASYFLYVGGYILVSSSPKNKKIVLFLSVASIKSKE